MNYNFFAFINHTKQRLLFLLTVIFLLSSQAYSQPEPSLDAFPVTKILVVGDSLSAAYKLAEDQGWVHLMAERLKQKKPAVTVVNASVSGATTAGGLQLLPTALKDHQPDLVILELGANDGLQGKPVPYIRRNLQKLIKTSLDSGAKVVLVGIKLPPNFGSRYTEPFYAQYAQLAEEFELARVPFLLEGVAGDSDLMMSDGLHPNAKAQPKVLENVWPVVKNLL